MRMPWRIGSLLALAVLASAPSGSGQSSTRQFVRVSGPSPSVVEGGSVSTLQWSNALPGLAYRVQLSLDLRSTQTWATYMVCHATGTHLSVNMINPDPALFTAPVPAGTFQMGDALGDGFANEQPVHAVTVGALLVDRFEVSWSSWWQVYSWALLHGYDFDGMGGAADPAAPVMAVSWYDCVKWCNARSEQANLTPVYCLTPAQTSVYRQGWTNLSSDCVKWSADGYRLPTEAEWERLARGGAAGHRYPWTNVETISHFQANYWSRTNEVYDTGPTRGLHPDFAADAAPVGSFSPNDYGLYDAAGNMWEWCWDWFSHTYYSGSPADNPRGPAGGAERVARGGSLYAYGFYTRCSYRNFWSPTNRFSDFGFRCVRNAP